LPAVLVTTGPILTGLILGVEALAGLIAGVTLTGVLLEIILSNSGGSLGALRKILASEIPEKKRHGSKMLVTGDDLFGDTLRSAGPLANILVKVIAFESLILGPFL
jgi:K(+)-stimulated pyrophosphate-energized sodium pump